MKRPVSWVLVCLLLLAGAVLTPAQGSTGNCATCHIAKGANGAPGRIIAPSS